MRDTAAVITGDREVVGVPPTQEDPGKAARAASGIPVVPAFDGYRTLAIAGVVLFHVLQVSGALAAEGDSPAGIAMWGVLPAGSLTTLFIVSGFVMFLPAAARGGDLGPVGAFAIRRAARLLPAYWVCLVVALILIATLAPVGFGEPGIAEVIAHFGGVQTPMLLFDGPVPGFGGSFDLGFGVVPPVWTFSVEVGFYILLPLVARTYFRHPFLGLVVAGLTVVAWRVVATNIDAVASPFGIGPSPAREARFELFYASQLPNWLLALACGMTCAWVYVKLRGRLGGPRLERLGLRGLAVAVPVLLLIFFAAGHAAVNDPNPSTGLFARQSLALTLAMPLALGATMLAFSFAPSRLQSPVGSGPIRWLADISYSVFLIHFAVIWVSATQFSLPTGSLLAAVPWLAIVFPASGLYAWASTVFLERPVRRWARRFAVHPERGMAGLA